MEKEVLFYPLSECAVVVKFGHEMNMKTHQKVKKLSQYLNRNPFTGLVEVVPTYTTVTIYYNPLMFKGVTGTPYQIVCEIVETYVSKLAAVELDESAVIEIPVCYGEDFGPDLSYVAAHNELDVDEVVKIHTAGEYSVYMLGFVPGFPYLGGMSKRISTPRQTKPRQSVVAGSVGIAGNQTGIYPIESPGGWQIIGRTPVTLFQSELNPPSLMRVGDIVRFYSISRNTYDHWEEETT